MWMVLLSMLLKKMEEVIHKMKNGIDAYKHVDEEGRGVDSGGRIQEYDEDGYKGSHPERKVQFFLTFFKKPLTPPPFSFEHYVVNFSEGILTKVRKRVSQQLSTK